MLNKSVLRIYCLILVEHIERNPTKLHYSQTRELIQEIELLEEEVVNREQHVLSLYRSIFDQCLSRPPSEQSSVMTSPAHTKKNENRRHPSIISSTFCSSKKFPLQHFQVLASKEDSRKKVLQSKTRHASLLSGKTNIQIDGNCSDPTKVCKRTKKV